MATGDVFFLDRAERERGEHEAHEAERKKLLQMALPVMLRVVRTRGEGEDEALPSVLSSLHQLATNPTALTFLLRGGVLPFTLKLLSAWPKESSLVPPPSTASAQCGWGGGVR